MKTWPGYWCPKPGPTSSTATRVPNSRVPGSRCWILAADMGRKVGPMVTVRGEGRARKKSARRPQAEEDDPNRSSRNTTTGRALAVSGTLLPPRRAALLGDGTWNYLRALDSEFIVLMGYHSDGSTRHSDTWQQRCWVGLVQPCRHIDDSRNSTNYHYMAIRIGDRNS
jgi:hypothetical protein